MLRAVLLAGLAAGTAPVVAACTNTEDEPDPLRQLAATARRDARDAAALAEGDPSLAAQLRLVADTRKAHATALQAEVDRERPPDDAAPEPGPARGKAESVAQLGKALAAAEQAAMELVARVPTYRAGLLGSVVAACASLRQLAPDLAAGQEENEIEELRPAEGNTLAEDAVEVLQEALGAEHAAMWAYGLVSAYLPADFDEGLGKATAEHRARRDGAQRMLTVAGSTPRPAQPGYVPPEDITDQTSATTLVVQVEDDCTIAWRAVLEHTDNAELRGFALRALTSSARRCALWRAEAGEAPSVLALPGKPG
ncbi:uncharacterized protein DUF4439 [Tamaricihabitans halophyticus]|uniref:Uncharacterized protein DUF4439 n=1 Tax=Tamaricihabitans halophyticus TaxID=1262583 RepID=A0A4R2QIC6_9PSEU|nr:ferritin-like domain-containing protein [Tamaricihabitans halophyticus]TCP46741.1 uncharacterized protein DUF4439 [Tamaricihabitans halophyticus]